jgi:ectoine hydroxylase
MSLFAQQAPAQMTAAAALAATLEPPSFNGATAPSRAARLSRDEIARFRAEGYALLNDFFSRDEIGWLAHEADILARRWRGAVATPVDAKWAHEAPAGTLYGLHDRNESLRRLSAHPRLVAIAQYVLGGEVGVHQSRLLHRQMTSGDEAVTRRDFAVWSGVDGMKRPQALTAAVFLSDPGDQGSAFQVVPRSHRASPVADAQSDRAIVTGRLGSVLLYDANLAYVVGGAAGAAFQPVFLLSYNLLSNEARAGGRTAPYAAIEPVPVVAEADDCLWPSALFAAG